MLWGKWLQRHLTGEEQREERRPEIGKELPWTASPGAQEPVSPHHLAAGGVVAAALVPTQLLGSTKSGWPGTLETIISRFLPPEHRDGWQPGMEEGMELSS